MARSWLANGSSNQMSVLSGIQGAPQLLVYPECWGSRIEIENGIVGGKAQRRQTQKDIFEDTFANSGDKGCFESRRGRGARFWWACYARFFAASDMPIDTDLGLPCG